MFRIIKEIEPQLINFLIIVMDSDPHSVCCCDKPTALSDMFILELYICFSLIKLTYSYHFKRISACLPTLVCDFQNVPTSFQESTRNMYYSFTNTYISPLRKSQKQPYKIAIINQVLIGQFVEISYLVNQLFAEQHSWQKPTSLFAG